MRSRLICVCRVCGKYLNKNVGAIRDGKARREEAAMCRKNLYRTHGVRQIADSRAETRMFQLTSCVCDERGRTFVARYL